MTDQVERLRRFETEHPGILIVSPDSLDALWSAHRDGRVLCAEYRLGKLLDELETLTTAVER